MTENTYSPPVDQLLTIGVIRDLGKWLDYPVLGFTDEHIPDLIRMALDPALNFADSESVEVWAPVHASRTLGQLRAQEAIDPLLALFHMFEDEEGSDWTSDDLPDVYRLIGAAAIPALAGYLLDESHGDFPREIAARSLRYIAEDHPDFRADCIAPIIAVLEKFETNSPLFNALMMSTLTDMKAEETLPLMERVFASENVELFGFEDWDDVQVEFGLKEPDPDKERFVPPVLSSLVNSMDRLSESMDTKRTVGFNSDKKVKAKRKQAAKSRKLNRKRK